MDHRNGIENNGRYKLDMVQRRAARCVLSRHYPKDGVTNMIGILGWRTLKHRRAVACVLLLYKIVNGLVAKNPEEIYVNKLGKVSRLNLMLSRKY